MEKEYKKWHEQKTIIHSQKDRPFFHEREVWFASVGVNIGFEQDGRGEEYLRPVIVLRKFNNEVLWGIPLTKNQKLSKYYFSFEMKGEVSTAILSQIRLVDSKRLQYKIGDIERFDFNDLKRRLRQFLA